MRALSTMRYLSTTEDTEDTEGKALYGFSSVSPVSSVVESFSLQCVAQREP
jgi:hypothetical protein